MRAGEKQSLKPRRVPSREVGRRQLWLLAALGLGTLALYAPSIGNGLTNWDDPDYVTNNPFSALGFSGVVAAFTRPFDGTWYPLTHATYVLLKVVSAPIPLAHLVQVLLFAVAVGATPLALEAFRVPRPAGLAVAVLWAVHPLRVESVAWLANLKDTLGIALLVVSFALYGARRRRASLAAFIGALLAKSAFFGLGLLFPVVELLASEERRAVLKRSWPWLASSALIAAIAGVLHLGNPARPPGLDLGARLATALWTPWWYLGRIALPLEPRAVYDFDAVRLGDLRFWAALGLWALLAVAAWRWKQVALVALAALLALAPVGGLVPLRFVVADRYTLIPSIALFAGLATGVLARFGPKVLAGAVVALALPCAVINVGYQQAWYDGVTLWERTVSATPAHPTVRMNLADAYLTAGRPADAREQTIALLQRKGDDARVLTQLYWLSGVVDRMPPEELEPRRERLAGAGFEASVVLDEADWCLSRSFASCAEALLAWSPSVQTAPRALRMRSALARRQQRPLEAIDLAARAIAAGERRATIELVYALTDAARAEEALGEAQRPMPDALSSALLRGARAYALNRLGRVDEARQESAAAMDALRALGKVP